MNLNNPYQSKVVPIGEHFNRIGTNVLSFEQKYPDLNDDQYGDDSRLINTQPKWSLKSILGLAIYFMPVVIAGVSLIIGSILVHRNIPATNEVKAAVRVIENVRQNLMASPISQLATVNKGNLCPNGMYEAVIGQWYGVHSGCICDDGSVHKILYCQVSTSKRCQRVSSIDPLNLNNWNGQKFCWKQVQQWIHTNICPPNQQQCTSGLCVGPQDTCPISVVHKRDPTSAGGFNGGTPAGSITVNGSTQDLFSNPEFVPLIGLTVTTGDAPCFDTSKSPVTESQAVYPLARQQPSGCGVFLDQGNYTFQLGTLPQLSVYNDNGLSDIINSIPYYTQQIHNGDTFSLGLTSRILLGQNDWCLNNTPGDINSVSSNIDSWSQIIQGTAISIIVFSALIYIIFILFWVLRTKVILGRVVGSLNNTRVLYILLILLLIQNFALGYVQITDTIENERDKLSEWIYNNCFSDAPIERAFNDVIDFASASIAQYRVSIQVLFWVSLALLIIDIAMLVFKKGRFGGQFFEKPLAI